ncbi:MAG: glucose-6-phosphate isomerase [Candidatus Eisenbacteria bacterium]|nr:glucose-6-phosphate isomerase [Candidatus Eisenbacteria bacterium]
MTEFSSSEELAGAIIARLDAMQAAGFARRFWNKDSTLWKEDRAVGAKIIDRLGWLDVVEAMEEKIGDLEEFAEEARGDYDHVLLLGMGGSSLCPDLLARTFGPAGGFPALRVLDSTDPAAVLASERAVDLGRTLFLVASKSGGTAEVDAFFRYFYGRVRDAGAFVAITDPGSPLEELAKEEGFRRVFLNPPDIGGRYSALSLFGLVPAALLGMDLELLLERANAVARASGPHARARENPGLWLGAVMAEAARAGRDKLTLIASPAIRSFGGWVEQLVAESTGKEGRGILPVDGEPLGEPGAYGPDRLFVRLRLAGEEEGDVDGRVRAIEKEGHPVITLLLEDRYDLGGEFFRWEVATAVAGALLEINPFDEPNVKESKDLTRAALGRFEKDGALPESPALAEEGGIRLHGDGGLAGAGEKDAIVPWIDAHLSRVRPGDYVALLAYLPPSHAIEEELRALRASLARRTGAAVTVGFGPRFLHSTGQFHKGGPNSGVFLQITAEAERDLTIPGLPWSFGVLERAQALGDLGALEAHGRRVLRLHIAGDAVPGIRAIRAGIEG